MAQILSNLPIGAKIKFGKHSINGETAQPITWLVVAKNHYDSSSITLLAEKVIDIRQYDAQEPTNPNDSRVSSGNSRYSLSNIHQWLNSNKIYWYTSQHNYDAPPDYNNRPGFLYNFESVEYDAIKTTTITSNLSSVDGGGYESISAKLFLPACEELNLLNSDEVKDNKMGTAWGYPTDIVQVRGTLTTQVKTYTQVDIEGATAIDYLTRNTDGDAYVAMVGGLISSWSFKMGITNTSRNKGVRPVMNLSPTLSISDTTDSDGCYTAIWNSAPLMPTTFNVPTTIYGGKQTTLSWSSVTDPDNDSVTYQLEQSLNGGAYTTIYSGANLSYTTTIAYGTTSVQFRVRTTDSKGASSGYNSSTSRTVINNVAPTISGSNSSLGTKNDEFTQTYTVSDSNSNGVTVTEAIDGVRVRSYTVTLGATNTFSVTGATWLTLANGSHTMTITATDGIDTTVRTYTFVKSMDSFTIQTTVARTSSTRPARIKLNIGREIPVGATFKVEVCNNGLDTTKTWEDATTSVTGGLVHLFSNTTKTATNWGVLIRVTVTRNNSSGACYISSIGGNFE